jgi:hypothetical protein
MKVTVYDRSSYRITSREYTDEGFLRVPGNVARTGIQDYLASELGLKGDPNRIIKVYRPPEEVFNADSLATYNGADITLNHPVGMVNADNYKIVSKGVSRGDGQKSDIFVQCDLIIKDAAAIKAVNSGKCELSAGYSAIYDETPGVTLDGEKYDYVQREIRINHIAIVDRGRAGALAKIFDNETTGGNTMPVLITTDSGRSVDVADPANAQVVADAFDRLLKRATTAEDSVQRIQAVADGAKEELAKAVLLSNDTAIGQRVALIAKTGATARKIAGDSFKCESVDSTTIMRAALNSKFPTIDWAAKSDVYVQARFDMADEEMTEETEEEKKTRMEKEAKESSDSGANLLAQLALLSKDGANIKLPVVDSAPPISRAQAALNARTGKVKA